MNNKTTFLLFFKLLILLIISNDFCYSQTYNFTNYTIDQGLPQSTIYCVFNDSRGYLWVGTEGGVARFDGNTFETFDRSKGLPGNVVRGIVEDSLGNIWLGTDNGLAFFDGRQFKILGNSQGFKGSSVTKLATDNQHRIWVATNDAGINVITIKNDSYQVKNLSSADGLPSDFVLDIFLKGNETWLAQIGGLCKVTSVDTAFIINSLGDTYPLPSVYISCIDIDNNGNIWLGTLDNGVYLWKKNTADFISCQPDGIIGDRIWDIFCDTDGSVWFATEKNGVYYLKDNQLKNITKKNGLPGDQVFCMYRDHLRNLWLGFVGQGLSLFQGFQLVHYTTYDGLPGEQILAVKSDQDNVLWLGTNKQGLARATFNNDQISVTTFNSKSGYKPTDVTSIDFDGNGNVLAGTRGEGFLRYVDQHFYYLTSVQGLLNNNISCVYQSQNGSIYLGTDLGFNEVTSNRIYAITEDDGLINAEVQTVIADKENNIWMGTMGGLARFQAQTNNYRDFNEEEGLFDLTIHTLACDKNNTIWMGTNNGIYCYYPDADTIKAFNNLPNAKSINSLLFYNDSVLVVGTNRGFNKIEFSGNLQMVKKISDYDKTNGFKSSETNFNALCSDENRNIWFGTVDGLTCYRSVLEDTVSNTPHVLLKDIRLFFEPVDWQSQGDSVEGWNPYPEQLSLSHHNNHITFDYTGIYLKNPGKVVYRYKLEPHESAWSPITKNTSVTYPALANGNLSFWVMASADGVHWSAPLVYRFIIRPPFWKTWWFILLVIAIAGIGLFFYIHWREFKLKKEKANLELVVKERTAEVVAQKEEIEHQKEEITDSITYARRIQQAVLPGVDLLQQNTADCFILFKPRDIVSGDYYWIGKDNNHLIVTAADCTGHGVPGAFMSMLGVSFLNKIVNELKVQAPDQVLNQMRANVIGSLKQGDFEGSTKDGMDMALCVLDTETLKLQFAGAYNSAVLISNNEAVELKADRMPVAYHIKMDPFSMEEVQLKKGDCIYVFSDGFQDQIGGPQTRKFMKKNMRQLLLDIHQKPFAEQKEILNTTIENWKNHPDGKTPQMDDILVIGFRV